MPNSCSSLVFVKLFVWHEKLFLVNAKLFQCQIVAAPWSTWNCSFSGLSSWQPTTCLSSDLSISGKIIIINHHPNVSLRKKVHCTHNLVATYILTIRPFWLLVRSIYDSFKYQGLVNTFAPLAQDDTDLFFSGIFSIFHLHRPDQRHDLLPIYPCPLVSFSWCDIQDLGHFNPTSLFSQIPIFPPQVVLRSEHLCLGAVCVAHR